jgi:uncharacterized protein (UPF0276 family)
MRIDASSRSSVSYPGVGLRAPHLEEILADRPDIAWLEVHPENYMGDPGALLSLEKVREHYPLSLHGVALSLGSVGPLDCPHLEQLKSLIERVQPVLVSEHLSWSRADDVHLNDLLPLPFTEEALATIVSHVDQVQSALRRTILIENPSSYLRFRHSTLSEPEFLKELVRRSDCGVLLDVNNLFVSAHNVGLDLSEYLRVLPPSAVGEMHLAGHARNLGNGVAVLIDDHGSAVSEEVWSLYAEVVRRFGPRPTLIEWDTNLPALSVLIDEARHAQSICAEQFGVARAHAA